MVLYSPTTKKDYNVELRKFAGEEQSTCPECSENRKKKTDKCFSFNHDKQTGRCNHCGASFVPKKELKEYKKPPEWVNKTNLSDKAVQWFLKRGILQETLIKFKIGEGIEAMPIKDGGYKEINTIQFPYFRNGELVNIKYRGPKKEFKQFKDAEPIFFNLDSIKDSDSCCIVEGEIDCMSVVQAGAIEVISVPSGGTQGKINLDYLDNCIDYFTNKTTIYLATDDDPVGRNLQEHLADRLGKERCLKVKFRDSKDANECLQKFGVGGIIEALQNASPFPIEGTYTISDYSDAINDIYQNGLPKGAKTMMTAFNEKITYHKGYIYTITGIPSHGKALAIDTDIPTPDGWKKMGDLNVFDRVYDENGKITYIMDATEIMYGRPCYEVVFSDGTKVIADESHLWFTSSFKDRCSARNAKTKDRVKDRPLKLKGTDQRHKRTYPSVKTTKEISETLTAEKGKRFNHCVPLSKPVFNEEKTFHIHPYVLGAWLGDGTSASAGFTTADKEMIDIIESFGYSLTKSKPKYQYNISGLASKLRKYNLIKNKHIPTTYMFGSEKQRLELLRGLMDTDGYCDKNGVCEFTTIKKELGTQVLELARSLGIRATMNEGNATLYGRVISKKYRVAFVTTKNVFRLKRKRIRLPKKLRYESRYIVSCNQIDSVPVRCIQVDSPNGLFLCSRSFIPTHNSDLLDQITLQLSVTSDWKGAFYSPENKPTSLHITKMARKLIGKAWDGPNRISRKEVELVKAYLNDKFFFIKPENNFTLDSILKHIKILKERKGIDFFVIDAWNKLEHKREGKDEGQYIGDALDKLANFCEMTNVLCFLVAHPTKMLKDKNDKYLVPRLYDISGSANFYNKSDAGLSIYRDFDTEITTVYIQKVKNSHWGKGGFVEFKYDLDSGRFNEYSGGVPFLNKTPWIYDPNEPQPPKIDFEDKTAPF